MENEINRQYTMTKEEEEEEGNVSAVNQLYDAFKRCDIPHY